MFLLDQTLGVCSVAAAGIWLAKSYGGAQRMGMLHIPKLGMSQSRQYWHGNQTQDVVSSCVISLLFLALGNERRTPLQ